MNHIILFNNCVIIIPENKLITFEINNSFTNNQKPNPMDPNQNKNHQTVEDDNDGNSQTETKKGAKRKRIKSKL